MRRRPPPSNCRGAAARGRDVAYRWGAYDYGTGQRRTLHNPIMEETGPAGASIPMGFGEATLLVAIASVAGTGNRSTVQIRMCNGPRSQAGSYDVGRCIIPTAQLRAGLNELWRAFDEEAAVLKAQRRRVASGTQRAPAEHHLAGATADPKWILPE